MTNSGQAIVECLILFPLMALTIYGIYWGLQLGTTQLISGYRAHEFLICVQNREFISECERKVTKGFKSNNPKARLTKDHHQLHVQWQNRVMSTRQKISVSRPLNSSLRYLDHFH